MEPMEVKSDTNLLGTQHIFAFRGPQHLFALLHLVKVWEHLHLAPLPTAALPLKQPVGARGHRAQVHRQPSTGKRECQEFKFCSSFSLPLSPWQEVPGSPCKRVHSHSGDPDAPHSGAKVVRESPRRILAGEQLLVGKVHLATPSWLQLSPG